MTHANMSEFNKCAANILDALYENFPVGREFEITEFPELDCAEKSDIFYSTLNFLKNEDYVRIDQQYYGGFAGVVLTAKGLSLLNATPAILEKKESFRSLIQRSLKSGGEQAISEAVKKFFSYGAGIIIENLP